MSSFQSVPGVSRSNSMNALTKSTSPRIVKTTPASTFAAKFLSASGVMSLSSQISAGAVVKVRGSIGSRIVAHTARHVLHFGRAAEAPATPLGKAERGDQEAGKDDIHEMSLNHSSSELGAWSLSRQRICSKAPWRKSARMGGMASSARTAPKKLTL